MKQIIIHIGNYKTGSTSIQNAINANRERLINAGFYVPRSGFAEGAHHDWARSWMKRPMAPAPEPLFDAIRTELDATTCERILISSEVFFTAEVAKEIVDSLPGYSFRVICYLRRPDHFYSAFYQQLIKHAYFRETQPPSVTLLKSSKATHYLTSLDAWADAVGGENVEAYPFEKEQFGGDLLTHFFGLLALEEPDTFRPSGDMSADNVTIHNELLEYLRAANALEYSRQEHTALLKLLDHIAELPGADRAFTKKNVFSPADRRQILADTKDEIDAIARKYARVKTPGLPLFLEADVEDDPEWKGTYLDTNALARISSAIWIKQQSNTISVLNKMSYAKGNLVSYLMDAEQRIRQKLKS